MTKRQVTQSNSVEQKIKEVCVLAPYTLVMAWSSTSLYDLIDNDLSFYMN